jgi:DNA replication protein DnaC
MDELRVPPRFKSATMDTLDKKQFGLMFEYLARIDSNVKRGLGLLLSGPAGVGKSWATVGLTRAAQLHFAQKGVWFDYEFVTAYDFFENIPSFDSAKQQFIDDRRSRPWLSTYVKVPWLILNDLGKENRSGQLHAQVVYKLGRVLRARSERMLVTHITTNLPLKAAKGGETFQSVYGDSIMSLLAEMVKASHINGTDKRRGKR